MLNPRNFLSVATVFLFVLLLGTACEKDNLTIGPDNPNQEQPNNPDDLTANGGFLGLVAGDPQDETDEEYTDCFTINFPIEIVFPDGTAQSANSEEELLEIVELWFEDNQDAEEFPTLTYPISVTLADGTSLTVNDEEELCDLYHECFGDDEDDDEDDDEEDDDEDEEWDDDYLGECFTPVYPFDVTTPDGTTTVNNEEELIALLESLEDDDDLEIVFPFSVTLEEDGTTLTVNDEEELEELLDECEDDDDDEDDEEEEWEDCDELEDFEDCFTFVYPFDVTNDGVVTTIDNEDALIEFFEALDEDDHVELVYPIDLLLEDGTTVSVNGDEEIEEILEACD